MTASMNKFLFVICRFWFLFQDFNPKNLYILFLIASHYGYNPEELVNYLLHCNG